MIDTGISLILRNVVLPAGDALFGQKLIRRLKFLERAQWWTEERVHAERDALLHRVIHTAYAEVPFYRELLDEARVKPDDIRKPEDLAALPIVTKDMLRASHPHRTTRPTGQKTYESHTSGSTGKNFSVTEDAATKGWYLASMLLSWEWAGWRIGDPHMQTGMTLKRDLPRRLKDSVLRCHYSSAFDLDDAHLDAALEKLDKARIEHLFGYAASLYYFAVRARNRGWNRPLRSAVTWGDNLYPHFRAEIEDVFRVKVTDTYGIGEGIQVSAQCAAGNYHVHTLDVIVEYLNDAGNPVSHGESANLILTRLHAGPMPLIRYRVGDMGIRGDQSPCSCGRGFDRMGRIMGRDSDVVITPSGNRLIVEFFNGIVDDIQEIESFQVVQETLDSILIYVVPGPGFSEESSKLLVQKIWRHGAPDLKIDVKVVDQIGLTPGGKRRYVVSRVPPPFDRSRLAKGAGSQPS
jgi:phenylacetate-CoA ligase